MLKSCKDEEDFRQLLAESAREPVVLLKHSTQCPISAAARRACVQFVEALPQAACHEVLVIEQRPLSRWIAEETGITHQSPQALLLGQRQSRLACLAS